MSDDTAKGDDTAMGARGTPRPDGRSIAERLAAGEPEAPRSLGSLVERMIERGWRPGLRSGGRAVPADDLATITVRGPVEDSRRIAPGDLFVAIPGARADGHEFLEAATAAGAAAAIVERPDPDLQLAQVVVPDARLALAEAACWWYGDPSHELGVVGVTGTDGKTTTSFLAAAALAAAGIPTGLVGTVALQIGGIREPTPVHVTTPGAPELQHLLRSMALAGDAAAVVETTSHGLALDRVAGTAYDIAIFTNLTHEHLELHGTFEAYRAAKLRLFEMLGRPGVDKVARDGRRWPRAGIVNKDDENAAWFIAATTASGARVLTYGTDPAADVRATSVAEDARGLRVTYAAPGGAGNLALRLAGRFNVHNALAVVALGEVLGLDPAAVRAGLEGLPGVPGRMERIDRGQPFGVIVDFAHSPASLATVLDLLAPLAAARDGGLVVVFGSAGERDRGKRPMMGRVAGERARLVLVTDEDPRGEDREAILEEIAAGAEAVGRQRGSSLLLIADRREAIRAAFERARPGDLVLLAGKGHESTIEMADGPIPWDEHRVAVEVLAELGWAEGR